MESISYRGLVFSKFKNITDFANAAGWKRNKASRILNGIQEPDNHDIVTMATICGVTDPKQFSDIFFPELSTKWNP